MTPADMLKLAEERDAWCIAHQKVADACRANGDETAAGYVEARIEIRRKEAAHWRARAEEKT